MRPESSLIFVMPPVVEKIDKLRDEGEVSDWQRIAEVSRRANDTSGTGILFVRDGDPEVRLKLMEELADVAMEAMYAIQHLTKDLAVTHSVMVQAQKRHMQSAVRG